MTAIDAWRQGDTGWRVLLRCASGPRSRCAIFFIYTQENVMPTTPIFNDAQVATALTFNGLGLKWAGSEITYNFYVSDGAAYWHLTANQQSMAGYWMNAWNDLIATRITRVGDGAPANINFSNETREDISYADTSIGLAGANVLASASVVFNDLWGDNLNTFPDFLATKNLITPIFGKYGAMAYGHEIGHALGLSHPGSYNGSGAAAAAYMQDSQQYTIMSYFSASTTGAQHAGFYAQTPLMDDILAIQSLYGANLTTRSDATVYGFHSSLAGSVYDFSRNTAPILCIYDAGGDDTLDLSGYATGSRISLVAGSFSDGAGMTNNISIARGVTIENAIGGSGNDSLTGNGADNRLDGGAGADTLVGGLGDDVYVVDNAGDTVVEQLNQGTDIVYSAINYTLGANVENLTLLGTAAINGMGNTLNNVLLGNTAANTLVGGEGNDKLDGGAGADSLVGGLGDDAYIVDNVGDVVVEQLNQGTDTVYSAINYTLGANVENLTLIGAAATSGTGNALNNVLLGGGGNDRLDGLAGADTLVGGLGNDAYIVDNAGDVVVEQASQGTDLVYSAISYTLVTDVENLTLLGTAAINGTGNTLNNVLVGNAAANTLSGGDGNDTLIGGAGSDSYVIGRGNGSDIVKENDATAGNTDVLQFLSGVNANQLWFGKTGNDLQVSIIGTADKATVQNWYLGSQYHVEQIKSGDGKLLLDSQVQNLVQAMASFAPPAMGQTSLTASQQTALAPVLAANWH
jgi:Ca2+-binding RTX toxin-like protein